MLASTLRNRNGLITAGLLLAISWIIAATDISTLMLLATAAATAFVLVRYPWLAWVGLAAALPFAGAVHLGRLSLVDLMLAGAVGLWFADGVRRRTLRLQFSLPLVLTSIYVAVLSIALLGASDLGEAAAEVVKWLEFGIVLLVVPASLRPVQSHWLVFGLLAGATLQSIFGLYQFINRIGPEWFVILGRFMRASGSFAQPNPFAGYLGLTLPVAISLTIWVWAAVVHDRGRGEASPAAWNLRKLPSGLGQFGMLAAYSMAALTITAGLLASWSRGGWLGALAGVGAVVALRNRTTLMLSGLMLLLVLSAFMLGSFGPELVPAPLTARMQELPSFLGWSAVLEQPLTDENFSVVERAAHWVAALRMWEAAPWLGVGPGNYEVVYPLFRLPKWEEALGHAHNTYFNVLGESGLIGFSAYLLLWIGAMVWTWRQFRKSEGWWSALALGVFGVLIHLAVHNLVDYLFVQSMYIHVALWIALLLICKQKERPTIGKRQASDEHL